MIRLGIAVAAFITGIAIFMGLMYLRLSGDDNATHGGDVPVVVAATEIPAGTLMTEDMLEVVQGEPPYPNWSVQDLVGQISRVHIKEGERITASKILY